MIKRNNGYELSFFLLSRPLSQLVWLVALLMAFVSTSSAQTQTYETITGTLQEPTTPWVMLTPTPIKNWNKTIILDFDGNRARTSPSATVKWFLAQGYAYGGIDRTIGHDYWKASDQLVAVRQAFIDHYGMTPLRTLVIGASGGLSVALKAMEVHRDIFDGALVSIMGGHGKIAMQNARLDTMFVLKTLVNPQSPLKIVSLNNDPATESAALHDLVLLANSTAEGRARLALSAAFSQISPWIANTLEPAFDDYEAQYDQLMLPSGPPGSVSNYEFTLAPDQRANIEGFSGGNVSWNHGVDYTEMLARSGRYDFVKAMYKKAGLDLKADLRTLKKSSRIAADPEAVAIAERLTTFTGNIEGPIIYVDGIGEVADPPAGKRAYQETVRRAGNGKLLRIVWTHRGGHGSCVTDLERITAFVTLIHRLDTGKWGDTSAVGMNALAQNIASREVFSNEDPLFIENKGGAKQLRPWDVSNWGTYKPCRGHQFQPGKSFSSCK
jgi:hypothetical protein